MAQTARKILVVSGPPNVGKGTFVHALLKRLRHLGARAEHVSPGALMFDPEFRKTPVGSEAGKLIEAGHLISDELVFRVLDARLAELATCELIVFDGFPRTIPQADWLFDRYAPLSVLEFACPDLEVLKARAAARLVHPRSGRSYSATYEPLMPKAVGIDDETGEPLVRRAEDELKAFERRLTAYFEQTVPAMHHLCEVRGVSGRFDAFINNDLSDLVETIVAALGFHPDTHAFLRSTT